MIPFIWLPVRKTACFIMAEKLNSEVFLFNSETGELLNEQSESEIQYLKAYGCGIDCHSKFWFNPEICVKVCS